jgi:hypothetical protein
MTCANGRYISHRVISGTFSRKQTPNPSVRLTRFSPLNTNGNTSLGAAGSKVEFEQHGIFKGGMVCDNYRRFVGDILWQKVHKMLILPVFAPMI